jgi:SAM-dependent methyltransferase
VSLVRASAQDIPFADAAFDAVVMTWTLCSIPNPVAALIEMRRVLKPGGKLLFVEHGLSPDIRIARWQHRLTPCWKRVGGGCHLDRKMDDLIRAAGFQVDAVETGYMKGPKRCGLGFGAFEVRVTLCWRERDSNFRYLSQGAALSELIWRLRPRGLPALPVRQPTRP